MELVETVDGVELRYERSDATEAELRRLVAAEHQCCADDAIRWQLLEDGDRLAVRVTCSAAFAGSEEAAVILAVLAGRR